MLLVGVFKGSIIVILKVTIINNISLPNFSLLHNKGDKIMYKIIKRWRKTFIFDIKVVDVTKYVIIMVLRLKLKACKKNPTKS